MKKSLSIAVLAFGLSASIAHAQEPKVNEQDAIAFQALQPQADAEQSHYNAGTEQNTVKKSFLTKALALGGSVQARIESAKENVTNSLTGDLKEKFTSAKQAWQAGKAEWQSENAKQYNQSVKVSSNAEIDERMQTAY